LDAAGKVLTMVTAGNAKGWFATCGYIKNEKAWGR
jgi:hypothetical protein